MADPLADAASSQLGAFARTFPGTPIHRSDGTDKEKPNKRRRTAFPANENQGADLTCGHCLSILYEPTTLGDGSTVCRPCVSKLPSSSARAHGRVRATCGRTPFSR